MGGKTATEDPMLQWADAEVKRLGEIADECRRLQRQEAYDGMPNRLVATAAALEFLRRNAESSIFTTAAREAVERSYHEHDAIAGVAGQLGNWAQFVRDGMASIDAYDVRARFEASTDLMEQVQTLLQDGSVHPAAPVMLAGAALEEFLWALHLRTGEELSGKPGISRYADALQRAKVLNRQDVKDITSWAGLRNSAAHGDFDQVLRGPASWPRP